MSCLPLLGNCERHYIDPLVEYLNRVENRAYRHVGCPDVEFRNQSQPDGIYTDGHLTQRLVVERKTLVWPANPIERHRADHFLMDLILEGLKPVTENVACRLSLCDCVSLDREELRSFAFRIVETVSKALEDMGPGDRICSGKGPWSYHFIFEREREEVREWYEPSRGLIIQKEDELRLDEDTSNNLGAALQQEIKKNLSACHAKFQWYQSDRRILLVDPHGQLRHLSDQLWHEALAQLREPFPVSEIWLGMFDMADEVNEGWIFNRAYPFVHTNLGRSQESQFGKRYEAFATRLSLQSTVTSNLGEV